MNRHPERKARSRPGRHRPRSHEACNPLSNQQQAYRDQDDGDDDIEFANIDGAHQADAQPAGRHGQRHKDERGLELADGELAQRKKGRGLHHIGRGKKEHAGADIHIAIQPFRHDVELERRRSGMRNHAGESRAHPAENAEPGDFLRCRRPLHGLWSGRPAELAHDLLD